jgi:hypothetical protein
MALVVESTDSSPSFGIHFDKLCKWVGQVLADFYTPGLTKNQMTVAFGNMAGSIVDISTFDAATAIHIVLQAPLIVLAGEVEVMKLI